MVVIDLVRREIEIDSASDIVYWLDIDYRYVYIDVDYDRVRNRSCYR